MQSDRKTSIIRREIAQYIIDNPAKRWMEVATHFDVSIATITKTAKEHGLSRPQGERMGN
jgi:DNA-binding MurR/RpiR family transcriptional regulator